MWRHLPDNVRWALMSRIYGPSSAARRLGASVGEGCRLLSFAVSSEHWLVEIGDRVTITAGVQLVTHDGSGWLVRDERGRRYRYARIKIGDDVFIGVNSVIMPGVEIGSRVIVGAGSIVTRSIPDGAVVVGNPARIVGTFAAFEERVRSWVAERDLVGDSYRARVDGVVEAQWRPPLDWPPDLAFDQRVP